MYVCMYESFSSLVLEQIFSPVTTKSTVRGFLYFHVQLKM